MQALKAGVLYFAIVFGAGFVLGPIRILVARPPFRHKNGRRMEMPIMLLVITFSPRWIVRRLAIPVAALSRIGMGAIAIVLLLLAEFTLVLSLRGLMITEYFATRDPVAGTA